MTRGPAIRPHSKRASNTPVAPGTGGSPSASCVSRRRRPTGHRRTGTHGGFFDESRTDLASGIPRQETGTLVEKLVIPLNHFVLLGFLPLARMRGSRHPAYAAGCGQFFMVRRFAYEAAGGHTALQASLHSVSTEKLLHHRLDRPRRVAFEPVVHERNAGFSRVND